MFFRDRMPEITIPQELFFDHLIAPGSLWYYYFDSILQTIFLRCHAILCNAECRDTYYRSRLLGFEEVLLSICYRLLKFRSLKESRGNPDVPAMYHLGLTVFMMSTFLQFNHHKIINHRLLSRCLEEVADFQSYENQDYFYFWFVMISGIWVANDEDGNWATQAIRETTSRQCITTWDQARQILRMFPWVHDLHDEPGYQLWTKVKRDQ